MDVTGLSRGYKLYIEELPPNGFWSPFGSAPYDDLARLRLFRGMPLRPNKRAGSNFNLGAVGMRGLIAIGATARSAGTKHD